jgi:(E)-4-hydroxy-3-methylbut-2-enyl-diphosphate synthase
MVKRRKTRVVKIGNLKIGGNFPILVQSMTNTPTADVEKTVQQIKELEKAGCEIIRVGVPDLKSARALSEIKKKINIPLVADIHFSADLALEAIKQGVDKVRINPGNFPKQGLEKIVKLAKKKKIPIRIGINSGSLEKDILGKHKRVTAEMMVKSALRNIKLLEKLGFYDLVVSLKAPDVLRTVKAYELLAKKVDYPFHLGITEAGTEFSGTIKSAMGIGHLLLKGIGDTIRVSLSAEPVEEVKVGWEILKSLGLREKGVKIVSCPTCARSEIDVIGIAKKIEKITQNIKKFTQHRNKISGVGPLKIAVMGCSVNGLGEAREADLGIVGVKKAALITKNGEIIKRVGEKGVLREFKKELKNYF